MLRLMQWAFIISWAFTIHNRNRQMMESATHRWRKCCSRGRRRGQKKWQLNILQVKINFI